jgi:ribonuclease HI
MAGETWTVRIDGASRGNPGAAAYAMVIERPGQDVYEEAECLGETTNNVAEYTALLNALERANELGGRNLLIFSDSELMVKQMNGEYSVKNDELRTLHGAATERLKPFERVTIKHVRRDQNSRADALCNAALDGRPIRPALQSSAPSAAPKAELRARLVDCLRKAAESWSRGDAGKPAPEQVWSEIWTILSAELSH